MPEAPPSPVAPARAAPDGAAPPVAEPWRHFEAIIRSASDYFSLIDAGGRYRMVNEAYCRAHGRRREDLLGRTVAEVWGDDVYRTALREPIARCLRGEEVHYRAQFEFPGAGLRHYDVSLYPYASQGPAPTHVVAVTRDLTATVQAQELARLVLSLARAINQAPDFDAALSHTLREVRRYTGWDLGQAWCPSADGEYLESTAACEVRHPGLDAFCAANRKHRWRRGESLPGLVWDTHQPLWVPDCSAHASFSRGALARHLGLNAAMAIPVLADGTVVAVMEFLVAAPRDDDERLMGVVAAAAEQLGGLFLRKRVEVALRESEERYRTLVESANDVIFALTPAGQIAALNRAFESLTGWTRQDWIGRHFAPLLHPDDLPVAQERLRSILAGGPSRRSEYRVRKADGDYAVGEFTLSAQCREGSIIGLFGIGRDITERKRTEEQLDRFFNRSLDMHCLAGFDGFLKRVNPAWTHTLGYPQEELLTRPYLELVVPADRPAVLAQLARLQEGHDTTAFEMRCACRDGTEKWTLWNATTLPSQQLIIATGRDITARKRTEQAVLDSEVHYRELFHEAFRMQESLRLLSDQILQVQEQERTRISRDLHDEVGQALTAINMNLAVLARGLAGAPPAIEQRLADTRQLLEHTMECVHNFSRELRPAMLDDLGLVPTLRSYVKAFTRRTGIDVQLEVAGPEIVERLGTDRKTVVYRVVQEGLNNAAKHAAARRVEIRLAGSARRVELGIRDNGRGFVTGRQQEDAATPRRLGLLGIAERVRLAGGEFTLDSQPGRGTALQVVIPPRPG